MSSHTTWTSRRNRNCGCLVIQSTRVPSTYISHSHWNFFFNEWRNTCINEWKSKQTNKPCLLQFSLQLKCCMEKRVSVKVTLFLSLLSNHGHIWKEMEMKLSKEKTKTKSLKNRLLFIETSLCHKRSSFSFCLVSLEHPFLISITVPLLQPLPLIRCPSASAEFSCPEPSTPIASGLALSEKWSDRTRALC